MAARPLSSGLPSSRAITASPSIRNDCALRRRQVNDGREAVGPVMAVAGEQPDALAVALNDQAIAVMFDFVDPLGPVRNLCPAGWNAGLKCRFRHTGYLDAGYSRCHPCSHRSGAAACE